MNIFLETFLPNFGVLTLAVEPSSTVRSLKLQVESRTRIPLTTQQFMWKGSVLSDERTLLDASVPPGATLHLGLSTSRPRKTLRQHLAQRRMQALRSAKPKKKKLEEGPSEGCADGTKLPAGAPAFGRSRSAPVTGPSHVDESNRLKNRVRELETRLDDCDKKIHEQDNELSERERENARLRATLASSNSPRTARKATTDGALTGRIGDLRGLLRELTPKVQRLGECEELRALLRVLPRPEAVPGRVERTQLKEMIRTELARAGLSGLRREVAALRETDRQRRAEVEALRARVAHQDRALSALRHQMTTAHRPRAPTHHQQASPPPPSPMAIGATPNGRQRDSHPDREPLDPPVPHLNLLPKLSWESIESERGSDVTSYPTYDMQPGVTEPSQSQIQAAQQASLFSCQDDFVW